MKRHTELIHKLLEHVERQCEGDWVPAPDYTSYSARQVHYHIELCHQAGFLEVHRISGSEEPYPRYSVRNLTWLGHEMLETFRK